MSYLFNTFLYEPVVNALILLYNTVSFGDFGIAIIMLTIIVRLLLAPMYQKTLKQQAITQKIRPEMLKIQKEHKNNREKQTLLLMDLYKKHKINPFYMFLVLFIQIPILLALFKAFTNGINGSVSEILYPFISYPGVLNPIFLGIIDLNERNIVLIVFTAVAQFIQIKISSPANNSTDLKIKAPSSNVMGALIAFFTVFMLWNFPSALAVYWLTSTMFAIGQQYICNKSIIYAEPKRNNN